MSGHSKWAKIKHQKASEDAKKSKGFSKMARILTVEAKKAGGDLNAFNVKKAVERARAMNMPGDNITRALKKGADKDAAALEEVTYEAYGPGGSALIITGLTDSKNRTVAEIKHLLSLNNGNFASSGAAMWAFQKTDEGYVPTNTIPLNDEDGNKLSVLIEAIENHDDIQDVFTNGV